MSMRIHPREEIVRRAENELANTLATTVAKHRLTEPEALRAVNAACSSWIASVAKYAIREERHGDATKEGGLAEEPVAETLNEAIVAYVTRHPGCTSTQIGKAVGQCAAQGVATLAVRGLVHRERRASLWRYYPAEPTTASPKEPA